MHIFPKKEPLLCRQPPFSHYIFLHKTENAKALGAIQDGITLLSVSLLYNQCTAGR